MAPPSLGSGLGRSECPRWSGQALREEWRRSAAAYLSGSGAAAAAARGERQVALQLCAALGVCNDHGVCQDPAPARRRPAHPRGFGTDAHRKPGLGAAGEVLEPRGVSRGSRTLRKPRIRGQPLLRWTLPSAGFWNGEWPQEPGIGRGPGVFTARSASEVRSGHGCSPTRRSSASPPRNCQRSPGSDTSSAAQPAAVPGGGRGHKSPAPQPIRCLFLGEAGATPPPGADSSANRHREAPGNSGSCSQPRMNAANFCKRV